MFWAQLKQCYLRYCKKKYNITKTSFKLCSCHELKFLRGENRPSWSLEGMHWMFPNHSTVDQTFGWVCDTHSLVLWETRKQGPCMPWAASLSMLWLGGWPFRNNAPRARCQSGERKAEATSNAKSQRETHRVGHASLHLINLALPTLLLLGFDPLIAVRRGRRAPRAMKMQKRETHPEEALGRPSQTYTGGAACVHSTEDLKVRWGWRRQILMCLFLLNFQDTFPPTPVCSAALFTRGIIKRNDTQRQQEGSHIT